MNDIDIESEIRDVLQFFAYRHLPPNLQVVSGPFHRLAVLIEGGGDPDGAGSYTELAAHVAGLPACREAGKATALIQRSLEALRATGRGAVLEALDRLLEAKDCAVRAALPRR